MAYLALWLTTGLTVCDVWVNAPERLPASARELDTPLEFRRLSRPELEDACRDPANHVTREEIDFELSQGGECWAFLDGERIANRRWYVTSPVALAPNLSLHFGSDWVLGRREYTHPDYRGRRLLLIGGVKGTDLQAAQGRKGIFGIVEVVNWASRRASARVGSRYLGKLVTLGHGRFVCGFATGRCAELGIRVERGRG